ncbi:hypothetical protein [Donghicola tyrosinivorans]|uniref:Uncharacterized protein n=1 Tax=Donghicola tyrosinivorans TaxID=1652492 RepID=A0A2T0WS99_9RHOB|nr:hypothetical protein [Donghicola tyrosinivorans]PRY89424.1 hypothetical protein CLV74_106126 [Donghicola tyrosinivorans]
MPDMLTLRAHRFKALHALLTGETLFTQLVNRDEQPTEATPKLPTQCVAHQEAMS